MHYIILMFKIQRLFYFNTPFFITSHQGEGKFTKTVNSPSLTPFCPLLYNLTNLPRPRYSKAA